MKKIMLILMMAFVMTSCHTGDKAVIKGQFFGAPSSNIVLEELSPTGSKIIDSVKSSSEGKFKFVVNLHGRENPTFLNIRMGGQRVSLLVEKGERIELSAIGDISRNYEVTGSRGSEIISEYNTQTIMFLLKMDSLEYLHNRAKDYEESMALGRAFSRQYIKAKQAAIEFLIKNSTSLAAIIPLYQPSGNGTMMFDDPSDLIYYKVIADSLEKYYPTSPYVKSLKKDVKRIEDVFVMDSILSAPIETVISYPEISMTDATGKIRKLSDLEGQTILLSFTSSSEPKLKILNRELLDLYNKYKSKGLEIFEVSIDVNKAAWLRSITENNLPWIQVCDFKGEDSPALMLYNVKTLPSYFLIGSDGAIVGANLRYDDVEGVVEKLLK